MHLNTYWYALYFTLLYCTQDKRYLITVHVQGMYIQCLFWSFEYLIYINIEISVLLSLSYSGDVFGYKHTVHAYVILTYGMRYYILIIIYVGIWISICIFKTRATTVFKTAYELSLGIIMGRDGDWSVWSFQLSPHT